LKSRVINKTARLFLDIPFRKMGLYIYNNITGTILETGILYFLSNQVFHTYTGKYIVSTFISFEITMVKNYLFSYFKIWNESVQKNVKDFFKRMLYYNTNMAASFGVKLLIILFIERLFHLHVVYCNLLAMLFTGILNYLIQDKLIFRKT
jgi:putative flippase GtrA